MKVVRTFLLIFALVGSLAIPIFLLAVRHFQMESETADWIVSMWPRSDVALEDKRAVADMLVTYGELSAGNMLTYTALTWGGVFILSRFFRGAARGRARESMNSGSLKEGR
jgi:hypothetical protein